MGGGQAGTCNKDADNSNKLIVSHRENIVSSNETCQRAIKTDDFLPTQFVEIWEKLDGEAQETENHFKFFVNNVLQKTLELSEDALLSDKLGRAGRGTPQNTESNKQIMSSSETPNSEKH